MYELIVNLGRWQGGETSKVEDLSDETLREVAKAKIAEAGGADKAILMATQVVIWDNDRVQNLVAVYDIRSEKLQTLG